MGRTKEENVIDMISMDDQEENDGGSPGTSIADGRGLRLKKRKEMGESTKTRKWAELIPEALELIFRDLSVLEKLTVVPGVCKSWGRAVRSSYCWQEIDVKYWSKRWTPELHDQIVRMLVVRSNGSLCKLAVTGLSRDALFSFIADNASSLQTLVIPRSIISDSIVEQVADRLANITTLDLSCCNMIGPKALEAFGKNCKYLSVLCRAMYFLNVDNKNDQNDEAFAIAATMPNLEHLEVPYHLNLTDVGVLEILSKCKKLKFLNIRQCWNVELNEMELKYKYPNLKVLMSNFDEDFCYADAYVDDRWG